MEQEVRITSSGRGCGMDTDDIYTGVLFGFGNDKIMYECLHVDVPRNVVVARKTRADGKKYGKPIEFDIDNIDFVQPELFVRGAW